MDIFVSLEKNSKTPLYEQLYENIKQSILTTQYPKHMKLPSKRQLADFLSVSQTTVELAYAQLLAEGYIRSVPRVGYFVEDIMELPYVEPAIATREHAPVQSRNILYNFSPSMIDEESFPFPVWRKIAKSYYDEMNSYLLQSGHRQGEYELRQEIAHYLYHSRGISCIPEQIVIGSGTEHLLPMILRLLSPNVKIALENPGYSAIPFSPNDESIIPISVDDEGMIIEELERSEASIAYVTPSHQFPTGAILSAARRTKLLKWALNGANRYIIEDDYDSEFRYIGKPIAPLKSMDSHRRVIYLSTFTKSLMPSLRVAYFILPEDLVQHYNEQLRFYSSTVPRIDQHILARFMAEGHFFKHLNKMRKIYRKKHDQVIHLLQTCYPTVRISGEEAGMHILIHFNSLLSEAQLEAKAKEAGIAIVSISSYYLKPIERNHRTFLLGFGGIPFDQLEDSIHSLMQAFTIPTAPHSDHTTHLTE